MATLAHEFGHGYHQYVMDEIDLEPKLCHECGWKQRLRGLLLPMQWLKDDERRTTRIN